VFEPSTCRLARVDFEQAVTLAVVDGRAVTVSGPGLTGVAANWFAEGWLEVGTGLAREVRLILTSTSESGGSVVLTLNAPLRFNATGTEAALVPGCDGRWNTCDQKYANTVNFGGHRFAMGNLAIKALDIPAAGGAKK
jgi:uncharacterized phage protein (TIGR02218 family)